MQQLPDLEKTDYEEQNSCAQWTVYIGRRKLCVKFKTDTDNLIFVVYRYRNNLYLKYNDV